MTTKKSNPPESEVTEDISLRALWNDAVGKVFKLASKSYGVRTVTYTQVKAVKDTGRAGEYAIEVSCVEIVARVLEGKRAHSCISKEGVIRQEATGELWPGSFGEECAGREYERVAGDVLAFTTRHLDTVLQEAPAADALEVTPDLPSFDVTVTEAGFLRHSPFLVQDRYYITANAVHMAFESINEELRRASRGQRLTDVVDPVYVAKRNEAVVSLRMKLQQALLRPDLIYEAAAVVPAAPVASAAVSSGSRPPIPVVAGGLPAEWAPLRIDSIALALLGKLSAARLSWETVNPSEDGPIYTLGPESGWLDFVRWAHVSGRAVTEAEGTGRTLKSYFTAFNHGYTGPAKDGIYPLLKPAK